MVQTRSNKGEAGGEKTDSADTATSKGVKATKAKPKARAKAVDKAEAAVERQKGWNAAWDDQFDALQRFREENGHANVPQKKKTKQQKGEEDENGERESDEIKYPKKLRNWVSKQRVAYAKLQRGEKSPLTQERIERLESIGFDFDINGNKWSAKLEKLKEFKEIFQHCNVPIEDADFEDLGRWVKLQRENYWAFKKGNKSPMTKEREAALEALGFEWQLRNRTKDAAFMPNTTGTSADSKKQADVGE